jgi:hypothetical protein
MSGERYDPDWILDQREQLEALEDFECLDSFDFEEDCEDGYDESQCLECGNWLSYGEYASSSQICDDCVAFLDLAEEEEDEN